MNILITAASTAQAYQILNLAGATDSVILADSADLPAFMVNNRKFIKIPSGDSHSFAHMLLTICLDLRIDRVFALRKEEVKALAEARTLFSEYGIEVMVPPLSLIEKLGTKSSGGKIVIKDNQLDAPYLPTEADTGVFLINEEDGEIQISIFTAH